MNVPKLPQKHNEITPFWTTSDKETIRFFQGNVTDVLRQLPAKSVHCCVTSPPYWGLRDYGGDKAIEIGSEKTPDEYVAKMVEVFREIRRVLRDDGTLWLNLGDTYHGGPSGGASAIQDGRKRVDRSFQSGNGTTELRGGNLVGIPWRVALALQADGWVLRQDIIWHKPSPMPESVRNRCTKAHEYVFLFSKRMGYYYDAEAIKEKSISNPHRMGGKQTCPDRNDGDRQNVVIGDGRSNKRSVWTVSSQGYPGAHFATFPPKLITPMILAGTSEKGCCCECGSPWKRVLSERGGVRVEDEDRGERDRSMTRNRNGVTGSLDGTPVVVKTVGWEPTCSCLADVVPCTVLDPFMGSGTTGAVCLELGRRAWGIDLSEKYLRLNAIPRISGVLMDRSALAHLAGRKTQKVSIGKIVSKQIEDE